MSIVESEIKHYKSANSPSNNTDTVGGAASSTEVGSIIGEIFHVVKSNKLSGDAIKYQYKKSFVENTNADTPMTNTVLYLANALDEVSASGSLSAVSTSASDGNSKYIHAVTYSGTAVQTEDLTLNGITEVTGAKTITKHYWYELRDVNSGELVNATGDITIKVNGTVTGIIPASQFCALAIVTMGLPATLDDTVTTTNAETTPAGISFTKPRTAATGLAAANSGSLTNGSAQGIWWKLTVEPTLPPCNHLRIVLAWDGETV